MISLSYQLYGSREFPRLSRTLAMLAKAGYREVEGYPGVMEDPAATRAALDAAGLKMTSAHFGIDQLENDREGVLATAKILGLSTLYCPHIGPPERPGDTEGWKAFAARLQAIALPLCDADFGFGWHNHDFEFERLSDGTTPLDIILESAPDISWEADIGWIVRGGASLADWVGRHGDRITAVHIKDIAPVGEDEDEDEDGWADVGHGTLDWAANFRLLADVPVKHWVVEHDNPSDDQRFAVRSIETVRRIAMDTLS